MKDMDRETARRLVLFSLIDIAVLIVVFGALFFGYGAYVDDARERAAEDLASDYAQTLAAMPYESLCDGDVPVGADCLYAVYARRGDGEYEMNTPSELLAELQPYIGDETGVVREQVFEGSDGAEHKFLTYTVRLDVPSRECLLKIFVPSALADEMLADIGSSAIPFVVGFVAVAIAVSIALGYAQVKPLLSGYSKQKAFVNDMSHEIRTPLAIIRGNLDNVLASDTAMDDDVRESLETCVKEVDYMTDIASGLLNIVRAGNKSAGKEGNVGDTVSSVVDMYADLANMDDKAMIARIDSTQMALDRDKVKQLASILLDNAIKYTRAGDRINVKLKNTKGGCALIVSDTGIGVPKGDEEKIFERFYRAENVGEIQGTGLGLAIAKTLAESLGGTIRARANNPSGLEITVEFSRK